MKTRTAKQLEHFFEIHPELLILREEIERMASLLTEVYRRSGKLLVCGNGGSCADGGHIVGELMKGFLLKRPLPEETKEKYRACFGKEGAAVAEKLQGSLPAISLNAHAALISAFANDVDPELVYAQQVTGYAVPGDAVIGISTSGNAKNIVYALMAAKVAGASALALTGRDGGRLVSLADCSIVVPETDTYRIQEYHLAIYHLICMVAESEQFSD